jgi:hypothetical protein
MAHYALIDNDNMVVQVFVGKDENESDTDWEQHWSTPELRCLRTSFNTHQNTHINGGVPFRGNFAGIGYSYDPQLDAFIPPKPHLSFVFDEQQLDWVPPTPKPTLFPRQGKWNWDETVRHWRHIDGWYASILDSDPYPTDGGMYTWDENTLTWVEVIP